MYVPEYPGSQNAQVLVQQDPLHSEFLSSKPYKVSTFVTSDSSDQVFAFFKDKLLNRPFEDWRANMIMQTSASFSIVGFGRSRMSAPMYTFVVTVESKTGFNYVRVERYFFPGM